MCRAVQHYNELLKQAKYATYLAIGTGHTQTITEPQS